MVKPDGQLPSPGKRNVKRIIFEMATPAGESKGMHSLRPDSGVQQAAIRAYSRPVCVCSAMCNGHVERLERDHSSDDDVACELHVIKTRVTDVHSQRPTDLMLRLHVALLDYGKR